VGGRRGCSSEWSARGILRLAVIDMVAVLMGLIAFEGVPGVGVSVAG